MGSSHTIPFCNSCHLPLNVVIMGRCGQCDVSLEDCPPRKYTHCDECEAWSACAPGTPCPRCEHPLGPPGLTDTQQSIVDVCNYVRDLLLYKNEQYGNSALDPVWVFSDADPVAQIRVRIDDKLSRIRSSPNDPSEDTIIDLIGYLVLLRVAS